MIEIAVPEVRGIRLPFEQLILGGHKNILAILRRPDTGEEMAIRAANLVTDFGDEFYAGRAAGSASGSGYIQLGTGLTTNGAFSSDTGWTKGTGWSITGGMAKKTAGSASDLSQSISVTQGESYVVKFTLSNVTAGSLTPKIAGTSGTARSADGDYSETIVAGSGGAPELVFSADASFEGELALVAVSKLPAKTDTALETPIVAEGTITGSTHAVDTDYPVSNDSDVDNPDRGVKVTTWRAQYELQAAVVTAHSIVECALVTSPSPTNVVCRALFDKPFTKTSQEIMKLFINHTFNGV